MTHSSEFRVRRAILVEGVSDRAALLALAERQGRRLAEEWTSIVAMGGATNLGRFLSELGPGGSNLALAGLYDDAEEGVFRRPLHETEIDPVGALEEREVLERARRRHDLQLHVVAGQDGAIALGRLHVHTVGGTGGDPHALGGRWIKRSIEDERNEAGDEDEGNVERQARPEPSAHERPGISIAR